MTSAPSSLAWSNSALASSIDLPKATLCAAAHGDELQHQVRHAEPAFEFAHHFRPGGELEEHVRAFAVFIHLVGQAALAPFIDFVHGGSGIGQLGSQLFHELVDFLVRSIRLYNEQLFVNPHASSLFKPGARRLNLVMALTTPSAIMERTASAA